MSSVWLIGENNPYGADPYFALYPEPSNSAGGRLCRVIFGMYPAAYLRTFKRMNLLQRPKWSAPAAREAAEKFLSAQSADDRFVLLGRRVFEGFRDQIACQEWAPFKARGRFLLLPHPSGLCRLWVEPLAVRNARAALAAFAPDIAPLIGGLARKEVEG